MIIPVHCDKCESHEFSVDTDKLSWPFHSDMFPVDVDAVHSRTWIFPPGPVNMELTCPGCGGFPFEFRDGMPSGRLKVRSKQDARFLELVDWEGLRSGPAGGTVVEALLESDIKPVKDKDNGKRRPGRPRKK